MDNALSHTSTTKVLFLTGQDFPGAAAVSHPSAPMGPVNPPPYSESGVTRGGVPDSESQGSVQRASSDERRAVGVPSRSILVPSDWRWKLMQWMVPVIAAWCVADVYLGSNGIKVTVTSLVGLLLMLGWVIANFIRERSPEDALRVADLSLFLAAAVLIGQFCFAATRPDPALLHLAIQDLIIWAPLASGLSAFAYARKSWVPVAITAGTYAALSAGTFFFSTHNLGALQLPLHGLIVQALGILTMGIFFNRLRESVSLTIARLRLAEEQSHEDTLTGLFNRRKFDSDWTKTCEERPGACLLLFDIDHFKKVNDDFGHAAGDRLLAAVGQLLAAAVQGKGSAYRWGGEEFALIVHGGRLHARLIAQRIMAEVSSMKPETGRAVTLSAGLSVAVSGESPSVIFQRADDALLQAKRTGRNQLICAQSDAPVSELPSSFLQVQPTSAAPSETPSGVAGR
jgi:diguanylate cyclase (GGDEF)-like protein